MQRLRHLGGARAGADVKSRIGQKSKFAKFENLEKWIFANRENRFRRNFVFNFASIENVRQELSSSFYISLW
jgi:hypothetical protein